MVSLALSSGFDYPENLSSFPYIHFTKLDLKRIKSKNMFCDEKVEFKHLNYLVVLELASGVLRGYLRWPFAVDPTNEFGDGEASLFYTV